MADKLTLSEAQFERQVDDLAKAFRWLSYHTYDSRHSAKGFPDRVFVRGSRMIFAELKSDRGKVKPEQQVWIDAIADVAEAIQMHLPLEPHQGAFEPRTGIEVYLWRPAHLEAIVTTLR